MRCYTWQGGRLAAGLLLVEDEKLGPVVYLGEEGRGRRYEKVPLGRHNPPPVVDGCLQDAHPVRITIKRGTTAERSFFVLEAGRPDERVLVRVCTRWTYTRNTSGGWVVHSGAPENLVVGYGAHGDAGRIGSWDDGLVLMRPGDVLKIRPEGGYKVHPWALFVDPAGKLATLPWEEYERITALDSQEAVVEPL